MLCHKYSSIQIYFRFIPSLLINWYLLSWTKYAIGLINAIGVLDHHNAYFPAVCLNHVYINYIMKFLKANQTTPWEGSTLCVIMMRGRIYVEKSRETIPTTFTSCYKNFNKSHLRTDLCFPYPQSMTQAQVTFKVSLMQTFMIQVYLFLPVFLLLLNYFQFHGL